MFHFNKGSIGNPEIPMWVFKVGGQTYYVHHAIFENVSFETKETPNNPHTKGSLKVKGFYEQRVEDGKMIATVKQ